MMRNSRWVNHSLVNSALIHHDPAVQLNFLVSFFLHLSDSDAAYVCQQTAAQLCLSFGIMGGFSGDPVLTSFSYHMFNKRKLFVQSQKSLPFLLFALGFVSDGFSSLVLAPFYSLPPFSLSLWFPVLPMYFKFNLMMIFSSSLSVVSFHGGSRLACLVMAT